MVASYEEMASVRYLLNECARDLRSAGHEIADHVELGAMIEVPAAAIALSGMIRKLDFIAIGTNDLVQYTLAVDRNNDHARQSLRSAASGRAEAARADDRDRDARRASHVTLCGEMAGDTRYTALLLALGLTEFSMHPGSLLEVREAVNSVRSHEASLRGASSCCARPRATASCT